MGAAFWSVLASLVVTEARSVNAAGIVLKPLQLFDMPGDVGLSQEGLEDEEYHAVEEFIEFADSTAVSSEDLLTHDNGEPFTWEERKQMQQSFIFELEMILGRRDYLNRIRTSLNEKECSRRSVPGDGGLVRTSDADEALLALWDAAFGPHYPDDDDDDDDDD